MEVNPLATRLDFPRFGPALRTHSFSPRTSLETETPMLPLAWAGVALCVAPGSFIYKLGMCKSGTVCVREG